MAGNPFGRALRRLGRSSEDLDSEEAVRAAQASGALTIAECAPSMRGASVTARTKTAKLETGLELQVPEYMEQGERVRVDTRTGEFIQRVQ